MTELDPTRAEIAAKARKRVQQYLAGEALHQTVGGYDAEGDEEDRSEQ